MSGRYLWAQVDADIAPLLIPEQRFAEWGLEGLDAAEETAIMVPGTGKWGAPEGNSVYR